MGWTPPVFLRQSKRTGSRGDGDQADTYKIVLRYLVKHHRLVTADCLLSNDSRFRPPVDMFTSIFAPFPLPQSLRGGLESASPPTFTLGDEWVAFSVGARNGDTCFEGALTIRASRSTGKKLALSFPDFRRFDAAVTT
jgi:hypothetical protein